MHILLWLQYTLMRAAFKDRAVIWMQAVLALCLLVAGPAWAQGAVVQTPHVRAQLVAYAPEGIGPGKDVRLGLHIVHQPDWHTYWKNPGDSGLPTTLEWTLPTGAQASDIQWPAPKKLPFGPLMNYGYDGQVLLPVKLDLPPTFSDSTLLIRLRADWLVCNEICIPESGQFELSIRTDTALTTHRDLFEDASASAPSTLKGLSGTAASNQESLLVRVNGLPASVQGQQLTFFPEIGGVIEPAASIQQRWVADQWQADVPLAIQRTEDPTLLSVVLTMPGQPGGFAVTLTRADPAPTSAVPTPASTTRPGPVLLTLGLALLGGILLNLMPCVFPVLSLKVLSAAQSGQSLRGLIGGSLAYTAGVVLSTMSLGGLLLALRAAGEHLGWGFQLQSPMFIAVLAIVFTLIGLNLSGVFEVGNVLPQRVARLRSRHHAVDHFLTGVLTVALASPCTAPFMGAALGAALALPTSLALAIFAALGLGIATPYIVATWMPGLTARLPRPGPWMTHFKILMAFPMFATVIWLLWVLGQQVDIHGVMSVLLILLILALVVWIFGASGLGVAIAG